MKIYKWIISSLVAIVLALMFTGCEKNYYSSIKYELNVSEDLLPLISPEIIIYENGTKYTYQLNQTDFVYNEKGRVEKITFQVHGVTEVRYDTVYYYIYTREYTYEKQQPISHRLIVKYNRSNQTHDRSWALFSHPIDVTIGTTTDEKPYDGYRVCISPGTISTSYIDSTLIESYLSNLEAHPETIYVSISNSGEINVSRNEYE